MRQDDPSEAQFSYEVRFHGIHFKGGKIIPREQTEEEKAEADAAKNQKKPAAPAKGGAPAQDQATIDQLKADIQAKNESNDILREEWQALSTNQKFFRLCEDPFKEPAVRFVRDAVASSSEEPL